MEAHEHDPRLQSDTSLRGLLVTIAKESLVPSQTIKSTSSDFSSDLANLKAHLTPTQALYILLRQDGAKTFAAITYVPSTAPVRQKMLFASSRLTLVRELGTEHFRDTIFTTEPDELTESGFKKLDAHTKLEAPLTEEEQTLAKSPISLDTDVVVTLKALNLGFFPSTFSDHQVFKVEALNAPMKKLAMRGGCKIRGVAIAYQRAPSEVTGFSSTLGSLPFISSCMLS